MPRNTSRRTKSRKRPEAYAGWTGAARPTQLERDRANAHGRGSASERVDPSVEAGDPAVLGEMESIGEGCFRRLPTCSD